MPNTKPKRTKGATTQYVFDSLRREILDLEIEPGAPLDEMEIGRRFGVSRSPVREALVRLGANGLVEAFPNRSAVAARLRLESLSAYLDAQELAFRVTARGAASRITPEQVEELIRLQADNDRARAEQDTDGMIQTNRRFHLKVAEIAGNPWYTQWLEGLMDQGQRILKLYMRSLDNKVPLGELKWHHVLLDALRDNDPDAADEAARHDAEIVRNQLINMLSGSGGGAIKLQ
ncbi:MAG: GntR family transcriptional regulator [bacterium]|nr:GntR family transcriptional regulator [bacterium]